MFRTGVTGGTGKKERVCLVSLVYLVGRIR